LRIAGYRFEPTAAKPQERIIYSPVGLNFPTT